MYCTTNRDLNAPEIHLENPRTDCTWLQLPTNTQIKRKNAPPQSPTPPGRNAYIDSFSVWKMPVEMQSTLADENCTDLRFVAARIRRRRPPPVVRLRRGDLEAAPPRGYPPPPRAWSRPTSRFALRRRGLETAPTSRIASADGILKPHLAASLPPSRCSCQNKRTEKNHHP
jgi:hypothetical protein